MFLLCRGGGLEERWLVVAYQLNKMNVVCQSVGSSALRVYFK